MEIFVDVSEFDVLCSARRFGSPACAGSVWLFGLVDLAVSCTGDFLRTRPKVLAWRPPKMCFRVRLTINLQLVTAA